MNGLDELVEYIKGELVADPGDSNLKNKYKLSSGSVAYFYLTGGCIFRFKSDSDVSFYFSDYGIHAIGNGMTRYLLLTHITGVEFQ